MTLEALCNSLAEAFPMMLGITFERTDKNEGWLFPGLIVGVKVLASIEATAIFEWVWADEWKAKCILGGEEIFRRERAGRLSDMIAAVGSALEDAQREETSKGE